MVETYHFINNHFFYTYRNFRTELKYDNILITEMLQPTDTLLNERTSNNIMPASPSIPWSDTQNDKHSVTEVLSDTLLTLDLHNESRQSAGDDSHITRQTLQNLDRKIDKIYHDLARVNWSQRSNKPLQKQAKLTDQTTSWIHTTRHELLTTTARVVFCILNPHYIIWRPKRQQLIIKAPHRYDTEPLWSDSRDQHAPMQDQVQKYTNGLYINDLKVIHNNEVHFHFTPTRTYRDLLVHGKVAIRKGFNIKFTHLAKKQQTVFPQGTHLGNLHIIPQMHTTPN